MQTVYWPCISSGDSINFWLCAPFRSSLRARVWTFFFHFIYFGYKFYIILICTCFPHSCQHFRQLKPNLGLPDFPYEPIQICWIFIYKIDTFLCVCVQCTNIQLKISAHEFWLAINRISLFILFYFFVRWIQWNKMNIFCSYKHWFTINT